MTVTSHVAETRPSGRVRGIADIGSWEYDLASGRRVYSEELGRIVAFGLEPLRALESRVQATLEPAAEQLRIVQPDGAPRTVVACAHVVFDEDREPLRVVGVVQDITERVAREEELHRIAVQQAAVANLGRIALSGASLDFLFNQVTAIVGNVLGVELCHILQKRGAGELALVAGTQLSSRPIVSALTVTIGSLDERPWGVLGVHSAERRTFTATDGDFLRSVAAVLAQAIERDHVDAELRARALQQSAIAELGRSVLTKLDAATLDRAGALVARGLGIESARFVAGDVAPSLCSVAVADAARTFGAIVVDAARELTADDIDYVRTIANILAEAMGREEARAAAQELTRSLQLVLDSTREGITTVDAGGRCTMLNAAATRMFGRPADELLGAQLHELVHARHADGSPYPVADCPMRHVVLDARPRAVRDDVFWRADGTPFPVDYSAAPIVDGDRVAGAVVVISDVTERRKLEQKLEQADRLSSLGRLAATVAHEFNNVLMGISPFVEVIRRKPERTPAALDQIAGAIGRGKRVTAEILRFTRPAELVRAVFAVEPWLRDLAAELQASFPPAHRIVVDAVDPSLRVLADRAQLHQVMTNLLLNARDAMPDGGTIAIAALPHERFIHVTVRDTGCGMPEETLRHIFEPLFTTKSSGTGLGLAVAHQVLERHGGEIFAESAVGAGTTFHLLVPMAVRRLLIVDDDETVVAGLVALLELEGIHVDAVGSGAAALDYLRATRPDVVLLDVGLPDMDGTEIYARIAAEHPALPVVFSTGHADTARLPGLEHGHVASLLKPYDVRALLEAIEGVIR